MFYSGHIVLGEIYLLVIVYDKVHHISHVRVYCAKIALRYQRMKSSASQFIF